MTAMEICKKYNFSLSYLSQIKTKLNLEIEKKAEGSVKTDVYTEEDLKLIDDYVRAKIIPKRELNLQKLREEHPLVTDDRFFITSYFPNVIPTNLEDLYQEEK